MASASWCTLRYYESTLDVTLAAAIAYAIAAVAAQYPHSFLIGTLTCSNHSDTALYESYPQGQLRYDLGRDVPLRSGPIFIPNFVEK